MGHLFEIPLSASLNPNIEFFPGCVLAIFKAKYVSVIVRPYPIEQVNPEPEGSDLLVDF